MLDDKDIQKLKEVLATKEDIQKISIEVISSKEEIAELKQGVAGLREMLEYLAISFKVDKHEKWFQQIAEKLGLKLEY
jgi:hypothetical protein